MNKTAISTGADSGMGFPFAQKWARLGGNVLMCEVDEAPLLTWVEEINAIPGLRRGGFRSAGGSHEAGFH